MNLLSVVVVSLGVIALAGSTRAGELDPPAGPVGPTMRDLDTVEPRTPIGAATTPGDADSTYQITAPGSYYLTGNLIGESGKQGIEILSSNVTIDLMGFEVQGVPGSLSGISVQAFPGKNNITVLNGQVHGWGAVGVNLPVSNGRVQGLNSRSNTLNGIAVGASCVVSDCTANANGTIGISANRASAIRACTTWGNASHGIYLFSGALGGGSISGCVADSNGGSGIYGQLACISDCSSYRNSGAGFEMTDNGNLRNCTAEGNTGDGISVASYCVVSNCLAVGNSNDGIRLQANCVVVGNNCSRNSQGGSGAGIHATGNDNRITLNNCNNSVRGVEVDGTGSFIEQNTCSGNGTNWDVAAANYLIVVAAAGAPAVVGNGGGGVAPGSTDPRANFSY